MKIFTIFDDLKELNLPPLKQDFFYWMCRYHVFSTAIFILAICLLLLSVNLLHYISQVI